MKSRRAEIVAALVAAGRSGISGETLAGKLGVSRVAIAKHVSALREAGYGITAVRGSGYRVTSLPTGVVPVEVERLLSDPLWSSVNGLLETSSTNDDCKVLARAGAPAGTVIVCGLQTDGRGRLGRTWASPEGGAYLSALLRPGCAPADAPPLAPACALGVVRGLASLGVECSVKWPNDVLIDGKKVAGILLEMSSEMDCINWVVVGCGINVRRSADSMVEAAYVADFVDVSASAVAAAALDGIASAYRDFEAGGFAALAAEYGLHHALNGHSVAVRDMHGEVVAAGDAIGVDDNARLLVQTPAGIVPVTAGEVTLREPVDVSGEAV